MAAMVVTSTPPGPHRLYSSEAFEMKFHEPSQQDFMIMETQGEGNYASTVFSDTRDQETDHGLTLSPKIQSNDSWRLDAAETFEDHDIDALLGPVQFDLIADEALKNGLELDALFNDKHHLPESPTKRRNLTGEPPPEGVGPAGEQASYPISPNICGQAPRALPPIDPELQHHHVGFGEVGIQCGDPHRGRQPSYQMNTLIGTVTQSNLEPHVQCSQPMVIDSPDVHPDAQRPDSFDDDGSLFGNYFSSGEASIQCSPFTRSSYTEELHTRGTASYIRPALARDADVPIPSIENVRPENRMQMGSHLPDRCKMQEIELSLEADLLKLQQKYNQELSQLSQPSLMDSEPNAAGLSERRDHSNTEASISESSSSLPLSLISALASSQAARSIVEGRIRDLLPSVAPVEVPSKLNDLLENLLFKFNNDIPFKTSSLTWLLNKMQSNRETCMGGGNYEEDMEALRAQNFILQTKLNLAEATAGTYKEHYHQLEALFKRHESSESEGRLSVASRAAAAVSYPPFYFSCQLPESSRPSGICGAANYSHRTRTIKDPQWIQRKNCVRCKKDITRPGARRDITKKEFENAGGHIYGYKPKKTRAGG